MRVSFVVVPVVAALVLACGGAPEVVEMPVGVPVVVPVEVAAATAPAATPGAVADSTLIATSAPIGTDEASFVTMEVKPNGAGVPLVNELSGQVMGNNYTIAQETTIRGLVCAPFAPVFVGVEGQWQCTLAKPWTTAGLTIPAGEMVAFYVASTHVQFLSLPASGVSISGMPAANFANFDANGHLTITTLGDVHTFQMGLELPAGTMVTLDAAGNVVTASLMAPATVRGAQYGEMFELAFNEAGDVTSAQQVGAE